MQINSSPPRSRSERFARRWEGIAMDLQCLDHVHFSVPDLQQAKRIYGPFLDGPAGSGKFVDDYGGPAVNAYGAWHTSGGDFIQTIDPRKPAFGGPPIPTHGILSVSFRVADIDRGIAQAKAHGLTVRSRIGSEDIGLGKNVVQAQLLPEAVSGLPFELIEHQLPGEYVSLTDAAVEYVEFALAAGVELDAAARVLEGILGSAFEQEVVDREWATRSRLHPRLGLRLAARLERGEPSPAERVGGFSGSAAGEWKAGLRAISFRCESAERGIATARDAGLAVARGRATGGRREVELEPWANVAMRLAAASA
jgi:catechol 2,3-dioxygenase-like lactoylglutathione lyase family enzyme